MGYKIFDFARLKFSREYLNGLSDRDLEFLVTSGLAANDLSIFARLGLGYANKQGLEDDIENMRAINHLALFRTHNAKFYEYFKFIRNYVKPYRKSKVADRVDLFKEVHGMISAVESLPAYKLVESLRNNGTNHYKLHNVRSLMMKHKETHKFHILLSDTNINSCYVLSEEIAHLSMMDFDEKAGITPIQIGDWLIAATRASLDINSLLISDLFVRHPIPPARLKKIFVDNKFVQERGEMLPLLFYARKS